MKNTNTNKAWYINCFDGDISLEFSESVDIRRAFDAMKATSTEESWLDELDNIDTDTDTFNLDCEMYGINPSESLPSIIKAIAETFPSVSFNGKAVHSSFECYAVTEIEFSFKRKELHLTETFADETNGYMCPECGFMVAPFNATIEENEIECDDCGENIKISDLIYVPPVVTSYEFSIC